MKIGCFATAIIIGLLIFIASQVSCNTEIKLGKPAQHEVVDPALVAEGTLYVHFLDVGQGDCTLIDYEDIEIVIDSGKNGSDVVPYLTDYIDGPLEVIIATHPDADHIGDMDDIFDAFVVEKVYDSGDTKTTQTYARYKDAITSEAPVLYAQPKRGEIIRTTPFSLQVLNPEEGSTDDYNENSVVVLLRFGEVNIYLMGDAEHEAESEIVGAFNLPKAHFIKAGHHGSRTSSSLKFMNAIKPDNVIYSAGAGNSYGHPHIEAIHMWERYDAFYLGTDTHGTIVLTTDGTVEGSQLDWLSELAP